MRLWERQWRLPCSSSSQLASAGDETAASLVEEKLLEGQRALRRMRRGVFVSALSIGLAATVAGTVIEMECKGDIIPMFLVYLISSNFACIGGFAAFMAPLPDDKVLTMVVISTAIVYWSVGFSVKALYSRDMIDWRIEKGGILWADFLLEGSCSPEAASEGRECEDCLQLVCRPSFYGSRIAIEAAMIACSLAILCSSTAPKMQSRLWHSVALYHFFGGAALLANVAVVWARVGVLCSVSARLTSHALSMFLCLSSAIRARIHNWIAGRFEARRMKRSAAGIAGLVGSCSAKEALAQATARFRCISLASLSFPEVADNSPQPQLFERTERASLHECDAFISHSWHDDAEAKWHALQSWRREFVDARGREPRVWLDKCCIDQGDIESDLRCLPVFLSGCQELVVLSGVTYFARLWCILELFVFVHMGGAEGASRITYVRVIRDGHGTEDACAIDDAVRRFQAGHACCSKPGDRDRILGIIRAAFGGMDGFNSAVRAIVQRARPLGEVGAESAADLPPASASSSSSSSESSSGESDTEGSKSGRGAARRPARRCAWW